jgi:alpha-tubulin suppressor-like RCC1 family protein
MKRVTNFTNNRNGAEFNILDIKNKMHFYLFSFDYVAHLPKELKYIIMQAIYGLLKGGPNVSSFSGSISMVKTASGVYVCGRNDFGQLGLEYKEKSKNTFSEININNIVTIGGGVNYTIALNDEGNLFLSGGQNKVQKFKRAFSEIKNIVAISSGNAHVIALDQDGRVFGMGDNFRGQLALGSAKGKNFFSHINLENIIKISCGSYHTFALDKMGVLYGCGSNEYGQLGLSHNDSKASFTKLNIDKTGIISSISCGGYHTILLNTNGDIFSTGHNASGQLALGDYTSRNSFHKIKINRIVAVSCGSLNTLILNEDGNIYSCGNNGLGQLGLGDYRNRNMFTKIRIGNIISIGCGNHHTIVLNKEGHIYSCGHNDFGQLGDGSYDLKNRLTRVNNIMSM